MRNSARMRWALALVVALTFNIIAHGQDNADPPPVDTEPAAEQGFPWLCFIITVAALVGLYFFVRRREQVVGADHPRGRDMENDWYCQACDRDVSGPECPHCRAANPFIHDPIDTDDGTRLKRMSQRSRTGRKRMQ
jgi:hypothetical protein